MSPVHGKRVVGDEVYDKAVRDEVGGVHTFGVRVRGSIPENGPTNAAKRNTEHGPLVVAGAKFQDTRGKEADSVSIDDLRNILSENPTFFDSLYEAELARPDGAREDALAIFYEVERGIKGQGRQDVMDEIRTLLGAKRATAAANADRNQARVIQAENMAKRSAENVLLKDADRMKALRERQENLDAVKDLGGEDQLTPVSPMVDAQMRAIGEEHGLDVNTTDAGSAVVGKIPAKPEGDVNPETQQPGNRILTPKGDGTGADADTTGNGDEGNGEETEPVDFETYTKAELEEYLGKEAANVKGTGADSAVLKADLVKAAKKKQSKAGK